MQKKKTYTKFRQFNQVGLSYRCLAKWQPNKSHEYSKSRFEPLFGFYMDVERNIKNILDDYYAIARSPTYRRILTLSKRQAIHEIKMYRPHYSAYNKGIYKLGEFVLPYSVELFVKKIYIAYILSYFETLKQR